jgi:membrane protease YdiL (CAAX protease family)
MAVSLLISVAAGICEEVAFRGFVYNAIWQTSGETAALLLSSLAFGLAHFPVFGASTFLEVLFGLVFAMSYKLSGYNLFVPIVVHVVYDFVVLFVTWLGSTAEFKRRIDEMEWDILTVPADTPLPPQIDILARLVIFACFPSFHLSFLTSILSSFLPRRCIVVVPCGITTQLSFSSLLLPPSFSLIELQHDRQQQRWLH